MTSTMPRLTAQLDSIALIGPGLPSWEATQAVLAGQAPYISEPTVIPPPAGLPPAERRRTGNAVRIAIAVGTTAIEQAAGDASRLLTVFASSGGDGDNCGAICEVLASDDRQISPTRFHNSVHNAPSGYWSIATGARAASTSLCAYDGSFGAGLLETLVQVMTEEQPVVLIAYDTPYPVPLRSKRPIPHPFGVAMVFSPATGQTGGLGRLEVELSDAPAARFDDPELEALRTAIPAARSLPLLRAITRGEAGTVTLDYLDATHLAVQWTPQTPQTPRP